MRTMIKGVAIGLLGGLAACSNYNQMGRPGPQAAAAAPAPMVSQAPVAPDMVKQVQSKLRDNGYYKKGTVDGVWGPRTEAAVRSYQRAKNLTTNGELDVPTLQALNLTGGAQANNAPPAQPMETYQAPPPDSATAAQPAH